MKRMTAIPPIGEVNEIALTPGHLVSRNSPSNRRSHQFKRQKRSVASKYALRRAIRTNSPGNAAIPLELPSTSKLNCARFDERIIS